MRDYKYSRWPRGGADPIASENRCDLLNEQGLPYASLGDLADFALVIGIMAQVFLLEYYGMGRFLNWAMSGLIVIRVLFSGWRFSGRALLLGLLSVAGWMTGFYLGGSSETLKANILLLAYPFIYTLYIYLLVSNKRGLLGELFNVGFPVFNAILLINMAVMYVQYSTHGMIAATTNEINYFEDNISGMFSYASVHAVALYTSFVTLYNFVWMKRFQRGPWPTLALAYNVVVIVLSLYLATLNDNKALFIMLPLVLVMHWFISFFKGDADVSGPLVWLVFLYFFFTLAYALIPAFQHLVDTQVFGVLGMISESASVGTAANGSNERIAIVGFALGRRVTWGLGEGLGASALYASGFLAFNHFGQADMGSFLILMGIWVTTIYVAFFHSVVCSFIEKRSRRASPLIQLILLVVILITFLYTQCFTRVNCCMCLLLLCGALAWEWNAPTRVSMANKYDEQG